MRLNEVNRIASMALSTVVVAFLSCSCSNGESDVQSVSLEVTKDPYLHDGYESKFHRLATSSNMNTTATWIAASELCREISGLPKAEALPLLDQLLEIAISQHVSATNYCSRQIWYRQLFYIVHEAFCVSQSMRPDSYDDWEWLFRFFGKCIEEICAVENALPVKDCSTWEWSDIQKGEYLFGLKGDFKTWVHVMKDLYFAKLSKGLTVEQKADVYRRLEELNKYSITPTNFPGGKR